MIKHSAHARVKLNALALHDGNAPGYEELFGMYLLLILCVMGLLYLFIVLINNSPTVGMETIIMGFGRYVMAAVVWRLDQAQHKVVGKL